MPVSSSALAGRPLQPSWRIWPHKAFWPLTSPQAEWRDQSCGKERHGSEIERGSARHLHGLPRRKRANDVPSLDKLIQYPLAPPS